MCFERIEVTNADLIINLKIQQVKYYFVNKFSDVAGIEPVI